MYVNTMNKNSEIGVKISLPAPATKILFYTTINTFFGPFCCSTSY
jgi:hypothetical protein